MKKEKREETKNRTTAEQTAARLECIVVVRDTTLMASTTTLGAKEEALEKLEVEMNASHTSQVDCFITCEVRPRPCLEDH